MFSKFTLKKLIYLTYFQIMCYLELYYQRVTTISYHQKETQVIPVHDDLSLIWSQYLIRTLQHNNPSHNVGTQVSEA